MTEHTSNETIMAFLATFKDSIEDKIVKTNEKIDEKIEDLGEEMKNLNSKIVQNTRQLDDKIEVKAKHLEDKIDKNKDDNEDILKRMDNRLSELEKEMEEAEGIRNKTKDLRILEKDLNQDTSPIHLDGSVKTGDITRKRMIARQKEKESAQKEKEKENSFCSTFAQEMQDELEKNAARMDGYEKGEERRMDGYEKGDERSDIDWEVLKPKNMKAKVRKPLEIKRWFGEETGTSSSSEDDRDWTSVDRKKVQAEKKRKSKLKRKNKEEDISTKARGMLGIGPITAVTMRHFEKTEGTKEKARVAAVREMLEYHLDFNKEELRDIDIRETKESKDNVIYFAASNQEMLKEIHVRKAESRNDDLQIRNYIPPQMHARYMALSSVCADRRNTDKDLKTQIRFGYKDLEIYTKRRGSGEAFKEVKLQDFLEGNVLPAFDHSIIWKKYEDRPMRRKLNFEGRQKTVPSMQGQSEDPANRKDRDIVPAITRQHSDTGDTESKRQRLENEKQMSCSESSSNEEDEEYETPAGEKMKNMCYDGQ